MVKETGGSPKFPSYPYGCMPRSQTPVVSSTLAISRPGLLPSGACKPSAFPSLPLKDILVSTTLHISGLHHAACVLATPGFVRPLTGRHAGSLLTGWLGVSQVGLKPAVLTYWVTTTNFIGFLLLPRFRTYLGASKRLLGKDLANGTSGSFASGPLSA